MTGDEAQDRSRNATHHIKVSKAFFRALCDAISEISISTLDLYSFKRLLIHVLANPSAPLFRVDTAVLDRLCDLEKLSGDIRLTVRIESGHNDLLREFREYAEAKLARPISVTEAMRVCVYTVTGK